jgi:hypothetical protein
MIESFFTKESFRSCISSENFFKLPVNPPAVCSHQKSRAPYLLLKGLVSVGAVCSLESFDLSGFSLWLFTPLRFFFPSWMPFSFLENNTFTSFVS